MTNAVPTAELAICAVLSPLVLYVLFKHGRLGLLGWFYLFSFCALRIIAGAMTLSGSPSASTISNVGLSALLLAAQGVLHEARIYRDPDLNPKIEWLISLSYHVLVVGGIAIIATGASSLTESNPSSSDLLLLKVGIAILTVDWVLLVAGAAFTLLRPSRHADARLQDAGTKLLWAVAISLIFIGIRVVYTLAAFVSRSKTLNPTTGSLAVRVVLSLIPELVSLVTLLVAGLLTRQASGDLKSVMATKSFHRQHHPERGNVQLA